MDPWKDKLDLEYVGQNRWERLSISWGVLGRDVTTQTWDIMSSTVYRDILEVQHVVTETGQSTQTRDPLGTICRDIFGYPECPVTHETIQMWELQRTMYISYVYAGMS